MKIIFTNDDYGLTKGFTSAISECFKKGKTTSTSIRINGTDFENAVHVYKKNINKIDLGIHLNVTDGPTLLNELSNKNGKYKYNFIYYLLFLPFDNGSLKNKIIREFEKQYSELISHGIKPTHVDSQDHAHMVPQVFKLTCEFCQKHDIKRVRLVREPLYTKKFDLTNFLKFLLLNYLSKINEKILKEYNIETTDATYGVLQTNNMNKKNISLIIKHAISKKYNSIEIWSHPADTNQNDIVYTSRFIEKYANQRNRIIEKKALL